MRAHRALASCIPVLAAAVPASADFIFPSGGGTYTYNTSTQSADLNGALGGSAVYVNENGTGSTALYYSVPGDTSGTVTYVFDASPGQTFSTFSITQETDLYDYGTITGSYSTNASSSGQFLNEENSTGFAGIFHEYTTNGATVSGATQVTVTYTITDTGGTRGYEQLFREQTTSDTSTPFSVTATSTPEPGSLGLLGMSILGLMRRYRRHA
jgi:hypothetical protein